MTTRLDVDDLYRRYGHVIFRRCRYLLGREEEAMDALQEVFIRVLRYGHGFHTDRRPLPWLFQIANRVCFDRRNLQKHECSLDAGMVEAFAGIDPEHRAILLQFLERFDPLTREIVLSYYVEQMSMEEVSGHVGRSRKTVGKKLARFQEHLGQLSANKTPKGS